MATRLPEHGGKHLVLHHIIVFPLVDGRLSTLSYLTVGHVVAPLLASDVLLIGSPVLRQQNYVVVLCMLVYDEGAVVGCGCQTTLLSDHKGLVLDQVGHHTRAMGVVPRISVLGLLAFVRGSCRFHLLTPGG